eukprot:gene11366-11515_t
MAPRLHALGKSRGYVTISEFIHDRYLPPAGAPWVAHTLRVLSFLALQLPIFTYLITQFQALGTEVRTFTQGQISATAAVLVSAGILLVCDLLGGMRAVAYTDVLQGAVLFIGSIIFLIIQKTEFGGLPAAALYYRDPANIGRPVVALMQNIPPASTIVAYFDFVFKTSIAATMFPHLCQRLFAARDVNVMRRGMAAMNFTFFVVQLSSMITGWCAVAALTGPLPKGTSVFSSILIRVASEGTGQAFLSALLLASAACAMMSTADSALLAFSSMWVHDFFKPYVQPRLSRAADKAVKERHLMLFGRIMSVVGLAIGVLLGLMTIEKGVPNLTGLFSLQNVTPIHVAPSVWLGLHWRRLRGEAVAVGMITGLAVTVGLVFSPVNVKLSAGLDQTACGLSTAMIGFFVNIFVTVTLGLLMQHKPDVFGKAAAAVSSMMPSLEFIDIGRKRSSLLNPYLWPACVLLLLFVVPFYRKPGSPDAFVGDVSAWAFTALLLSGILALVVAFAYMRLWGDDGEDQDGALPEVAASSSIMAAKSPEVLPGGLVVGQDGGK